MRGFRTLEPVVNPVAVIQEIIQLVHALDTPLGFLYADGLVAAG
jgi:hypothetical protein